MDDITKKILKSIKTGLLIKKSLVTLCYLLIFGGVSLYIFQSLTDFNKNIKLVTKYKENREKYEIEKVMINPRIQFRYNQQDVYKIKAREAIHKNEDDIMLFDVVAVGNIGKISAGQLRVNNSGNNLEFSDNPVLIINGKE